LDADHGGPPVSRLGAEIEIRLDHERRVPDAGDVALLVEVEVRAADGEPDVRDLGVARRHVQRVPGAGGLEEVGAGGVHLGILEVAPRPAEGHREDLAGMAVRGDGDTGLEVRPDDPQTLLDARLQELEIEAVEERDERQLVVSAV
jgi:hypothetical protein